MIARAPEQTFADRLEHYRSRVDSKLEQIVAGAKDVPDRLHEAMTYSVLGGGKRSSPLLAYASAELFDLEESLIEPLAVPKGRS